MKKKEVYVSIIVPVYNTQAYLKECLDSLINQTLKEIEIIIINDGSTDNSINIIKEYEEKDNRIKLIDKENEGQSATRNKGLEQASGEYVAFVDSDDYIDLNMYENLYDSARKNKADLVICDYSNIKNGKILNEKVMKLKNESIVLNDISVSYYILKYIRGYKHGHEVWNRLYRRDLLINNNIRFLVNRMNGLPEIGEDLYFNLKYSLFMNKVISIPSPLYKYRIRENSSMTMSKPILINQMVNICGKFNQDCSEIISPKTLVNLNFSILCSVICEEYSRYRYQNRLTEFFYNLNILKRNNSYIKNSINWTLLKGNIGNKTYAILLYFNGLFLIKLINKIKYFVKRSFENENCNFHNH